MELIFWKLSEGTEFFSYDEFLDSINERLVYVHKDTGRKGQSTRSQGQDFVAANTGDYFYLTYGNEGVFLLGQFIGPANIFSKKGHGWLDRPFRLIASSILNESYHGPDKWWAPNHNSTFSQVPPDEISTFEEHILVPYFSIRLKKFKV